MKKINSLINDVKNECYLLYPGEDSIKLNEEKNHHIKKYNSIYIRFNLALFKKNASRK